MSDETRQIILYSGIQAISSILSVVITTIYVIYTNKLVHIPYNSNLRVVSTDHVRYIKIENIGPIALNIKVYIFASNKLHKINAEGIDTIRTGDEPVSYYFSIDTNTTAQYKFIWTRTTRCLIIVLRVWRQTDALRT
jgi:hypothetical protein